MNTASKSLPPVQQILKQWDTGKRLRREQILKAVIANGHVRTKEEIENLFEGAASLLLSRFVAWLHLSYAKKQSIALLLEAIAVLIRPMGSNSLRLELIEAGGVGTLTDLLCLDAAPTVSSKSLFLDLVSFFFIDAFDPLSCLKFVTACVHSCYPSARQHPQRWQRVLFNFT
eukprot:TRINITY_DN10681_c0_g1_i10.p1 TRINITY_DN10681_c0_g1~~TRINITY_DN10681_c0_g1_i10.p1  ORF type:complete len:172 (+),score=12.97 TRINITY_DN10681_c0_g1_i10:60-575(+)